LLPVTFGALQVTLGVVFAAAFALSAAAQDAATAVGAPADAFPKPDRPVADIISPSGTAKANATMPVSRSSSFPALASNPA